MVQNLAISIPSFSMDAASMDSAASSDASSSISAFAEIPLTALSKNTRRQLSNALSSRKILRSEEGYERDWRGLAALSQQKSICDESTLNADDPLGKVLQRWCSNNPKTATFANLERFLGVIDRWDVCDDIYENLVEDARNYNLKLHHKLLALDDETDTASAFINNNTEVDNFGLGSDVNILTKDDVERAQKGLPPQKYDAFVLFADADINYAVEMIIKLEENPEFNFKLCSKDRDLLAGVSFAHVALTELIEERCKHLIVILTKEFMKSPENKFLVDYTQALQIQNKTRKIIPLIYEDNVVIPGTLKIYTHLKYSTSSSSLFDFWGKLASSIRNVNISVEAVSVYKKDIYSSTRQPDSFKSSLTNLPTPPTDIPSININGHAFVPEDDIPKKKERNKFKLKRGSLKNGKQVPTSDSLGMRNAHSTSQLNNGDYHDTNVSMSDLSTKKKKWPSKLFKKVFSRSSSKLQEPA